MNEKNNGQRPRDPRQPTRNPGQTPPQKPRRPLTEEEKQAILRRRAEMARRNGQPQNARRPENASRPADALRRPSRPTSPEGRRPESGASQSKGFSLPFFSKKPKKAPEPPPRRRNDESYVFSRSLSETHERIMAERRERLEDARVFRREDVNQKMKYGIIAFCAVLAIVILITTIAVSCSLSGARVKKGEGEYTFNIGKKTSDAAYKDTARGGVIYISMNSIAELCQMTVGGSTGDLRFTVPSGDWISFSPDSTQAKINGYGMEMPAPARMKDTQCSIPLEFLGLVLDGIEINIDEKEKSVTVTRKEYNDSTPLEPHYVDVSFMLTADLPLDSLNENKYFSGQPLFTFKNDLTEYEEFMNPTGSHANDFLLLVNKQNPIGSDFAPGNLGIIPKEWVNPDKRDYITLDLDATAIKALEAMMKEMHSAGFTNIFVTSAYRSYSYQSGLYNTYIENEMNKNPSLTRDEAKAIVETYSAIPGYSEHHSGLCVDLWSTDMTELTNEFADKEVYDWLCANAWKFGFVLRYPENKVDVTEYSYESWHWRFVGRTHALAMIQSGECLEEYLARTGLGTQEDKANG